MTFAEADIIAEGFLVQEARQRELPRLIAAILINANRDPKKPAVKPEEIMTLYTDAKKIVELMSKDEYEELKEWRKGIKWQTTR